MPSDAVSPLDTRLEQTGTEVTGDRSLRGVQRAPSWGFAKRSYS